MGLMKKERKHWNILDALLLDNSMHIANLPTMRGMLKGGLKPHRT